MSSTPLLERAAADEGFEWVDVVPPHAPRKSTRPTTGWAVLGIAELRRSIAEGTDDTLSINTDELSDPDEYEIAVAQYADDVWDD